MAKSKFRKIEIIYHQLDSAIAEIGTISAWDTLGKELDKLNKDNDKK